MTTDEAKDYIREWCPYDKQDEIIKALSNSDEDCISRKAVLALKTPVDTMTGWSGYMIDALDVEQLPSIQLKQKIGHWILIDKELSRYKCSECGEVIRLYKKSKISKLEKDETLSDYPFSHCGCRMVEPQESEG